MSFLEALRISSSGLNAQRARMKICASNLANANTTRTADGGPYRRQDLLLATDSNPNDFKHALEAELEGVRVEGVVQDPRPPKMKYDPSHPDANEQGMVAYPNVSVIEEMVNIMTASRSYEAGVTAIGATKNMAQKALEIGK